MRVLVTGGAGFIGSNFVHYFLSTYPCDEIIILDKLTYAGSLDNLVGTDNFTFIEGDICDPQAVTKAMIGCDAVVNFAAETHVDRSITQPDAFLQTNVPGTYVLLETAKNIHIQRFIQISTDEVYGDAGSHNGSNLPSLETDSLMPLSPYAASKVAAERLAYSYWATYNLPVIITRCSNNYGPRQYPEKQLPLFICNALNDLPLPIYGDGKNSRDWIHVHDHIAAIDQLLHADTSLVVGEAFNIGTSEERTILQNARTILDIVGKSHDLIQFVPDRKGHVRRHAVNTTKIRQAIGWQPQIPFSSGIRSVIEWYKKNIDWVHAVKQRENQLAAQVS